MFTCGEMRVNEEYICNSKGGQSKKNVRKLKQVWPAVEKKKCFAVNSFLKKKISWLLHPFLSHFAFYEQQLQITLYEHFPLQCT